MSSYYEKMLATGEVKCIDEEVPFEVPQGWEWCRLRDVILGTNAGKSPNCEKRPKKSEEWGVLTTTSIQENAFLSNENKVLPKHYVINPEHCVRYGDILITRAGPVNRTGIVCMVENNCDKLILSDKTVRIDYMHDYCNPKFLVFVLNSSAIHELVMSATVGMAASQVNVSQSSIQNTLIPFPPSKEQQRIINKLEALLPQIEKYDNAQNKLDELNKTVKDIIKKSVLQEAIQGKLVSQLEEEGTAKELLEQIKAEKQKLVKEGKLKKSALINSIIFRGDDNKYYEQIGKKCLDITDEIPFVIPETWQWVRIRDVFQLNPKNEAEDEKLVAFIPMEKISAGYKSDFTFDTAKWGTIKKGFTHFANGDVAFAKITPCFQNRKSAIFHDLPNGIGAGTTELKVLRPYGNIIDRWYLLYFLESPYFIDEATFKGTANQQRIVVGYLEDKLFPLPTQREQQRIVAQIEKLFEQLH